MCAPAKPFIRGLTPPTVAASPLLRDPPCQQPVSWGWQYASAHSKDDVERCKQKDLLEQMMAEMIGEFPDLHRTIVSERDIYLTYMLRQAARRLELPRASEGEADLE